MGKIESIKNITLYLTNVSATSSAIFNLFKSEYGTVNQSTTQVLYKTTITYDILSLDQFNTRVNYSINGSPTLHNALGPTMDQLMINLNAFFANKFEFSYEFVGLGDLITEAVYNIYTRVLDQTYTLDSLVNTLDTYYPTQIEVATGTTVMVNIEGGMQYDELISELAFQPYVIRTVNLDANTHAQASKPFLLVKKTASGLVSSTPVKPIVHPYQKQYVISDLPLNFRTGSIQDLFYTIAPGESVRLILDTEHINQMDQINMETNPNPENQQETIKTQPINKPTNLLEQLLWSINAPASKSIKETIKPMVQFKKPTPKEIFSAFEDRDFTEL